MADEAALYLEKHRVRSIRLKIGRPGDTDMRACEAVRKRIGPGVTMRLDANDYYRSAKEAITVIRRLECFDLELVEQPLAGHDFAGHAEVRSAVGVPIGLDESIQSPRDALAAIHARAGDVFNGYVSESGGTSAITTNHRDRGSGGNPMSNRHDARTADGIRSRRSPRGCLRKHSYDLRSGWSAALQRSDCRRALANRRRTLLSC